MITIYFRDGKSIVFQGVGDWKVTGTRLIFWSEPGNTKHVFNLEVIGGYTHK